MYTCLRNHKPGAVLLFRSGPQAAESKEPKGKRLAGLWFGVPRASRV